MYPNKDELGMEEGKRISMRTILLIHCKKSFSYFDFLSCFQPKYGGTANYGGGGLKREFVPPQFS